MDLFCRTTRGGIMIHIDLQPEPADFDIRVRQPGNAFLSRIPIPTSKQWGKQLLVQMQCAALSSVWGNMRI